MPNEIVFDRDTTEIVRLLVATGKWGPEMVDIAERARYRCEYCQLDLLASPENYKLWEVDHIIPKSSGGLETLENLALACRHCNCYWKGTFDPSASVGVSRSRESLIATAREYIQNRRAGTESELDYVRKIVGWPQLD
jgi:hypothetical protein